MTTITALNLATIVDSVNFLAMLNYALQINGLSLKDNYIHSVFYNLGRIFKTKIIDIGMAEIEYTLKHFGLQQPSDSTIRRSMKKLMSNNLIALFRNRLYVRSCA